MKLPTINGHVTLMIKDEPCRATCTDLFDGGYGYYFDVSLPKSTRRRFSRGQQCAIPELGEKCVADFVSYPKSNDAYTVRFLIPRWS